MYNFEDFNLPQPLHAALTAMRYSVPTSIQEKAIPAARQGRDLIGLAQTGTGKTAAFGIPLVAHLIEDATAQALILAPTRELAAQIEGVIGQLARNLRWFHTALLIGGASMVLQKKALARNPRVLIATPGRLLDHIEQRTVSLSRVSLLVLDEADRMLDIGFEPQLERIFRHVPKTRQTLLFSATFPPAISRLASRYLSSPVRIAAGDVSQPVTEVRQAFIQTTAQEKNSVLLKELRTCSGSVLIFTRTKHRSDRVARMLTQSGYEADRIHGSRTQGQRTRVMEAFRNRRIRILVATDIASRGLDVAHIAHVINYDLPEVPEDYVHRIGRTARAGASGRSLCFVTPEDSKPWRDLSRHLRLSGDSPGRGLPTLSGRRPEPALEPR